MEVYRIRMGGIAFISSLEAWWKWFLVLCEKMNLNGYWNKLQMLHSE